MRPPTWIEPGRLIAGRHPCAQAPEDAEREVVSLISEGVTLFVDLTQEGELEPYGELVRSPVRSLRFPVRDFTVPDAAVLTSVLDTIDTELEADGIVYVHCWAGCGRTGVVVGCWLVRHGTEPQEALARIADLRGPGCPQTVEQRLAVLAWEPSR
jgi:protein-tyrosine phosphatase